MRNLRASEIAAFPVIALRPSRGDRRKHALCDARVSARAGTLQHGGIPRICWRISLNSAPTSRRELTVPAEEMVQHLLHRLCMLSASHLNRRWSGSGML